MNRRNDLINEAKKLGFDVTITAGGHLRFQLPGRPPVFGSSTSSDVRAVRNIRAKLRRSLAAAVG